MGERGAREAASLIVRKVGRVFFFVFPGFRGGTAADEVLQEGPASVLLAARQGRLTTFPVAMAYRDAMPLSLRW